VHVSDPDFYDELYTGISRKRNRDPFEVQGFGLPDAVLSSPDHEIHRMRRAVLNPYFSKQAISRIEPVVMSKLEILCSKLEESRESNEPVDVELAFMALTVSGLISFPGWTH
jgi:cytochrome P450